MNKSRIIATYIFVTITFIILFIRYTYIQLLGHINYQKQSINNYSSILPTLPIRGAIIDNQNTVLTTNVISYAIGILPKEFKTTPDIINIVSQYANITELDKKKFSQQLKNAKNYDLVILKDDLSNTEIANLTAHNYEFPTIQIFARTKRYYPFNDVYSHSIGYVGKISTKDFNQLHQTNPNNEYLNNDYLGKNGLEKYYESELRGIIGKKIIQTDSHGNEIGLITNIPAINGKTIKLTINNNLQQFANNVIGNNTGAIVAIEPQTGGILAFVSKPGYDPNWFIEGISTDDWDYLRNNPNNPLLNRASQSSYPPGSTFKPFLGLAAIFLKFASPTSTIYDPGYFIIPGSKHKFRDNPIPYGLGVVTMAKAIALSSDTYFYKLAYRMGIDNIDKGVSLFGFGSKTGVDLPNEASGLLPSREWKAQRFKNDNYQKNWLPADSVTVGIGQGFNHYTPLQLAYATTIIANDGLAIRPHFLKAIIPNNGKPIPYKIESHNIPVTKKDFEFMKQAMQMVITQGTAKSISYGLTYTMAGKTGTAQVVSTLKNSRKQKFEGKRYKDHSWFIAFAPVEPPKLAIAIIMENGGWGTASAQLARKIFDYYLLNQSNNLTTHTENSNESKN